MLSAPRRTCARAFQSLPVRRRAHQPVRRGRSVLSVSAVRSGEDAAGSGSGALVSFAGAMVGWAGPWPGKKGAGSRTVECRRGCSEPLRLGYRGPVEIGNGDVELGIDRRLRLEWFGFPRLALPAAPPPAAASTSPSTTTLALGLGFGRRLGQSRILLVGLEFRFAFFRLGLRGRHLVQIRFLAAPSPPSSPAPSPGRFAAFGDFAAFGRFAGF